MVIYKPNNIIFTGGCESGKSSQLLYMKDPYKVVPERVSEVEIELRVKDKSKWFMGNLDFYAREIIRRELKDFDENGEVPTLFDRGLPDGLVIFPMRGYEKTGCLQRIAEDMRYNEKVFLFEVLPNYDETKRPFSYEKSLEMGEWLYNLYRGLGYNVIRIPIGTLDERKGWLHGHLQTK